ncbi:hypothetical protein Pcinc_007315 [Petrolisthes cinctipes]|uniref:Uncharacterized protein n=1 Tax=Petrolisthes cinctipes TaxID=88211 RepID=A0AAE1GB90_PETCI|nr:hypothetical protein Pcinc_007315 [Petrolisthes cinctipes]
MIVIFFSHLGTKSLKKNLKRKVGPSTSKCSVEVDPSVVTKKRRLSQHISFHQLPESAKEVMVSGPFEFTEVTKHCSDYNMLEEERMRVKYEQCNDKEKLEDGRMKVKIEDCSDDKFEEERMKVKVEDCSDYDMLEERMKVKVEDCSDYDMLEEERMKVKIEDCTDEDVIVKVEHDIDEDDESKSMATRQEKGQPLTYEQKLYLAQLIKQNPKIMDKSTDHLQLGQKAAAWNNKFKFKF